MIEKAISIIKKEKAIPISILSNRLGISKNETARLLKILKEQGILRRLNIEFHSTPRSHCLLKADQSVCSTCDTKGCIVKFLFS